MWRLFCVFLFLLAGCVAAPRPSSPASVASAAAPTVILISIDGFRPDYLDRGVTPNLNALAAGGVKATGMRPSFPSITFPNHYALVTGLRPDQNGIVGNTMTDPAMPGVTFKLSDQAAVTDRRWWDEAEPIWVTAERQGVRTGTMFWPGSEADIHGVRPSYWRHFDSKVSPGRRVHGFLAWLDKPASDRPRFLTLYFDQVDHAGHTYGPASAKTTRAVAKIDAAIGRLRRGLAERGLNPDIIIVSDHGMAGVSTERTIRLDQIAPGGSYKLVTGGPYAGIEPMPGHEADLAAALLQPHDHMQCWRKADVPERFHYGRNPRVPAFVCLAEVGWLITDGAPEKPSMGGAHGYDNQAPEMLATFLAAGPDFRAGSVIPVFDNVDVYPLAMKLIGLTPLPNDGTITPFASVLTLPGSGLQR